MTKTCLKSGKNQNNLQERDAGIYECQIPTQPPQSYPINLNIIGWIIVVNGLNMNWSLLKNWAEKGFKHLDLITF